MQTAFSRLSATRRRSRSALDLAVAAGTVLACAAVASGQTDVHWQGPTSGLWTDSGRWIGGVVPSNGAPPGETYHAFIDAAGTSYVVTLSSAVTVDELTLNSSAATLRVGAGGVLTAPDLNLMAGILEVNGGTLLGTTVNPGGGQLQLRNSAVLDNVTFDGNIDFNSGSARVRNGLTVVGSARFNSNTVFSLEGNQALSGDFWSVDQNTSLTLQNGTTTTLAGGAVLRGTMSIGSTSTTTLRGALVNNGTIHANVASRNLSVNAAALTNNGSLQASNGGRLIVSNLVGDANQVSATGTNTQLTLDGTYTINQNLVADAGAFVALRGAWTNTAGITATNNATVSLYGNLSAATLGPLSTATGGKIGIAGTYENTGETLTLTSAGPALALTGGIINGGTIATSGTGVLASTGGNLAGVSNTGSIVHSTQMLWMSGNWTNSGTITLTGGSLGLAGNFSTADTTGINSGSSDVRISGVMNNAGQTFTLDGTRSNWFFDNGAITGGTIAASGTGQLRASDTNRTGTLTGVTLTGTTSVGIGTIVTTDLVNQATVAVNSNLVLNGDWSNQGSIQVNSTGTLTLGGSFTTAEMGTITRSGNGVVLVKGVLDNTGGTLSTDQLGTVRLDGGTITGGTITGTAAINRVSVLTGGGTSTLSGVTVNGGISADELGFSPVASLALSNGTTVSGDISSGIRLLDVDAASSFGGALQLRNGGSVNLHGTRTLGGLITLERPSINYPMNTIGMDGGSTLTVGSTGVISGSSGLIGSKLGAGVTTIVNNGRITSTGPDGVLTVAPDVFVNNGIIEAVGSGHLSVRNIQGNLNTARVTSEAARLTLDGTYTINTPITVMTGTLNLNGNWTNAAGIVATNATVNLGGNFVLGGIGTITGTGTTVNIAGILDNTGGTLTLDNASTLMGLNGGAIVGGTVTTSNGQRLLQRGGSSLLSGVAVNGDVTVMAGDLTADATTTFGGEVAITQGAMQFPSWMTVASGTFNFNQASAGGVLRAVPEAGSTQLTLGPSVVVHGGNGIIGETGFGGSNNVVANQGLISADSSGRTLSIVSNTFTNSGTIEARNGGVLSVAGMSGNVGSAQVLAGSSMVLDGTYTIDSPLSVTSGSLTLNGAWTNTGGIVAQDSTLNLGGTFTTAAMGSMTRSGTTLINITGALDNTGGTLAVDSHANRFGMMGGTITGGAVVASNGEVFEQRSGNSSLVGVAVSGGTSITKGTLSANLTTTFADEVAINAGTLLLSNGHTLTGGEYRFTGNSMGMLRAPGTFTIGSGVLVHGGGGKVGQEIAETVVNQGTIAADVSGQTLSVLGTLSNQGLLRAINGGTLNVPKVSQVGDVEVEGAGSVMSLGGSFTNTGVLEASNGGQLNILGPGFVNSGTIRTLSGSTVTLAGQYAFAGGTVDAQGTSTIALSGTLNNTGTMTASGNVRFDGVTINGGTVNAAAPLGFLNPTGNNGVGFSGVTLNGQVEVTGTTSQFGRLINISNGLSGASGFHVTGTGATFQLSTTQTINGTEIFFDSTDTTSVRKILATPNTTTTLGPQTVIRGGGAKVFDAGLGTLVNQGRISADVSGQTLLVTPATMDNQGTLEATNGGILHIGDLGQGAIPWTNNGTVRVASGGTLRLGGIFTLGAGGYQNLGGNVELYGTLNNAGRTLNLAGPSNALAMVNGWSTIQGGTVNTSSGGLTLPFGQGGGRLVDTVVNGDVDVYAPLSLTGSAALNGTTRLFDGGSLALGLRTEGPAYTLSNNVVEFAGAGTGSTVPTIGSNNLVIAADAVVHGGSGSFGFHPQTTTSNRTFVNYGRISADVSGQFINVAGVDNYGTLEAINGGILMVSGVQRPSAVLRAIDSTMELSGGPASVVDRITRSNATIRFSGTIDNSSNTLNMDAGTTWQLLPGMRLKGGTVNVMPGASVSFGGTVTPTNAIALENLVFNGDINPASNVHEVTLRSLTLGGTLRLTQPNQKAVFVGNQSFDSGTIFFDPTLGGADRQVTPRGLGPNGAGFATITIGPAATIRGGRGLIRLGWGDGAFGTLINQGLISADIAGTQIGIEQQRFVNLGTVQAINGGSIQYQGPAIYEGPDILNPIEFYNTGAIRAGIASTLMFDVLTLDEISRITIDSGETGMGLIGAREINFGGQLTFAAVGDLGAVEGSRFDLFDFQSSNGTFASIELPQLAGGLRWDSSMLYVDGSVRVIPSPGALGVMSIGLLAACRRRRMA